MSRSKIMVWPRIEKNYPGKLKTSIWCYMEAAVILFNKEAVSVSDLKYMKYCGVCCLLLMLRNFFSWLGGIITYCFMEGIFKLLLITSFVYWLQIDFYNRNDGI
jgi:hypothetical protein